MGSQRLVSAGLLLFRRKGDEIEVFLAHPGGPFWAKKDEGAWTIPKGLVEGDEDLLETAIREFGEETSFAVEGPFLELGFIVQRNRKTVYAWAAEKDVDPKLMHSNTCETIWPPNSGRWLTIPEIDRCGWFSPEVGKEKINVMQAELIDRLLKVLLKKDSQTD